MKDRSVTSLDILIGVLLIVWGITVFMLGQALRKVDSAYEQGYQEGSLHTAELLKEISNLSPEEKRDIAVKWWTNTEDTISARKSLCGKPKSTQTKKE